MTIFITAGIFITGILIFSLSGGMVLFRSIFLRKEETSGSFKKELPGIPEQFTKHTRDPKIMDMIHEAKRGWKDLPVENVAVFSAGTRLAGYLLSGTNRSPTVMLVHGYCDSAAGMAYLVNEYVSRGFGVLAIDCRGHGLSDGKTIGMGYRDARDIMVWVDFLKERSGKNVKIILHGVSMGAAAVYLYSGLRQAALKKQYENIVCMIGDCGFSSYRAQMSRRLKHILSGTMQAPVRTAILCAASLICAVRCGFFFFQIEPLRAIRHKNNTGFAKVPLLIFQGEEDVLVEKEMSLELFNAAEGKKKLVLVPHAPHIGSYFYDKENYFKEIEALVNEELDLKK